QQFAKPIQADRQGARHPAEKGLCDCSPLEVADRLRSIDRGTFM
ncbi:hypothetical protein AVDCRST_MAG94-1305, partial [uncultured Leptolyngbya sp.]